MGELRYPVAPNGVFDTIQGEGPLTGVPMTFVRLAGCSVGCPECDTDYRVKDRLTLPELAARVQDLPRREWLFLTGGEPTDHDYATLLTHFAVQGYKLAMVTAGTRKVDLWRVDCLMVSPHTLGGGWIQREGTAVNVVPGLNGMTLSDELIPKCEAFQHRYATPLYGSAESLTSCLEWVRRVPGWRLGVQAHKVWGLP